MYIYFHTDSKKLINFIDSYGIKLAHWIDSQTKKLVYFSDMEDFIEAMFLVSQTIQTKEVSLDYGKKKQGIWTITTWSLERKKKYASAITLPDSVFISKPF